MTKFTSLNYWYSLMLMLVTVSFTACVDDNDDTEAPFLEVAPTTLTFTEAGTPAEGSQSYFEIKTNRSWTATVQSDVEWVTLSKKAGEGNARVEVSVPGGVAGEAHIDVVVGNKAGELLKETVKVICGEVTPAAVIYKETLGTVDVADKPLVGSYEGWDKSGDGSADVTYSGNNTSIRNSGLANTDSYEGASGPNVVFFGSAPATFVVNKIALQPEQTSLKLTFGASYSLKEGTEYVNTFVPSLFKVLLSGDGQTWVPVTYNKNDGDATHPYWVLCTADFTLKNASSELYIKFESLASSAHRLDDVTLCTGNGGQEIDLENGSTDPEPQPGDAIFYESVGDADASAKPLVDAYTGWLKQGAGAANVSYTGTSKVSVRKSGLSNAGAYDNASGPNVVFFGTQPTAFIINKIALQPNQTKLQLTFGASYSLKEGTEYINTFDPSQFKVSLSGDGQSWVPVAYNKNDGDATHPYWVLCTADFTLKNASSELYIKFESLASSAHRLDDIRLATGNGGQEIDLSAGGTDPEQPGEAKEITFQELAEKMSAPGIIDAEFDRTLVAVVQNNMTTGTRSYNNLQLAAVNANAAGQGITLYGNIIETAITDLSLEQGDKVKVTFIKNMAETKVYNGLNQVTGGKDEVWAKIEKLNEKVAVTPVEITVDQLKDYQSMTVCIKNATTQEAGVWCTAEAMKSTVLSVNGQNLTVFCAKGSAFAGVAYAKTTGDIVGIASVHSNNVQLVPRSLEDVQAFNSTSGTVTITGVNPNKLNFTAEGGEQKIAVTLAHYNNEAITATGLSEGKFTVSVSGKEVTVKANPNEGAAINETLTIAVAGGNSVTVPVAVAAAGGQGGASGEFTMTNTDIINGKTGSVELVSNSYGSQNVNDEKTWYTWKFNEIDFKGVKVCIGPDNNGGGIQVQGHASDKAKQGLITNVTALQNIQSIELVLKVAVGQKYDPSYSVYAGSAAMPTDNPVTAQVVKEEINGFRVYTETFDLSSGNYSYFTIKNDKTGALYIQSIKVTYKK